MNSFTEDLNIVRDFFDDVEGRIARVAYKAEEPLDFIETTFSKKLYSELAISYIDRMLGFCEGLECAIGQNPWCDMSTDIVIESLINVRAKIYNLDQ